MNLNITQFQLIVNVGKHVLVFLAHSCLFLLAIFLAFFFPNHHTVYIKNFLMGYSSGLFVALGVSSLMLPLTAIIE